MENLLQHKTIRISRPVLDRREECGVSGSFTLPDYCVDIASVMICTMSPHLINRQWSGDRLLIDGSADVRMLYLDEERCRVHAAEFSLPFGVECKADFAPDSIPVTVHLRTHYVNWRAVSPRCIEIRGGVIAEIQAISVEDMDLLEVHDPCIETRLCDASVTAPTASAEKVLTVSEQLDFPQDKPACDMLLGGTCNAELTECRLLNGKAIVKGTLYVHQMYSHDLEKGSTDCLNFAIPFSQILDVEGAREGQLHNAHIYCLSDAERCLTGPDGANTVLEVTAKVLVQISVWEETTTAILLDAYHTKYPLDLEFEELRHNTFVGYRNEHTVLPMPVELPSTDVGEILDVWVTSMDYDVTVRGQVAVIMGKMGVNVLWRDRDGCIALHHTKEEFRLELPCIGDVTMARLSVTEVQYRVDGAYLQLQIRLSVCMNMYQSCNHRVVSLLTLQKDRAYPAGKENLLMYYASTGESVWDIGRSCHASASAICAENDIKTDTISQPMLLSIPIV